MTTPKLKDVSLCAMVRDEMINPAGGIERFVRSIVPYVEQVVILDTGSVDGTRKELKKLSKEFPTMKVYDRPFDNYVNSRNASLKKVETEWTLVLDADELITRRGFKSLSEYLTVDDFLLRSPEVGYNFRFIKVDSKEEQQSNVHNPRLFRNSSRLSYEGNDNGCWEFLRYKHPTQGDMSAKSGGTIWLPEYIPIYHFVCKNPSHELLKISKWYDEPEKWKNPPSKTSGFKKWKAFNPRRNMEKFK